MVELLRENGSHHEDIIRTGTQVWDNVTEIHPTVSIFFELSLGPHQGGCAGLNEGEASRVQHGLWELLPVHLIQFGFWIKKVDLGGRSRHEDEDAGLGPWRVVLVGQFGCMKTSILSKH